MPLDGGQRGSTREPLGSRPSAWLHNLSVWIDRGAQAGRSEHSNPEESKSEMEDENRRSLAFWGRFGPPFETI